jgi:hypothetical protein
MEEITDEQRNAPFRNVVIEYVNEKQQAVQNFFAGFGSRKFPHRWGNSYK